MIVISEELYILFTAIWSGCVVYGSYTVLRVVRKLIPHREWMVSLEDFCFWIVISIYLFSQIFYTTSGNLRWYIVVGLIIGGFCAHIIWSSAVKLSRQVKKVLIKKG